MQKRCENPDLLWSEIPYLSLLDLELPVRTKSVGEHIEFSSSEVAVIEEEVVCPICLDIMEHVMVTECLHRYCRECINKHLRQIDQKRECPTCRMNIKTGRSLRKDVRMDSLVNLFYSNRLSRSTDDDNFRPDKATMKDGANRHRAQVALMRQRQKLAIEKNKVNQLEAKKYVGSSSSLSDINTTAHSVAASTNSSNQTSLGISSLITPTSGISPSTTSSTGSTANEIATVTEVNIEISAEVTQTEQIMQTCNKRLLEDANDPFRDKRQRITSDKNIISRQGAVDISLENGRSQKPLIKFSIKKHPAEFVLSDIPNGYIETTDDYNSAIIFDVKKYIISQLSIENCNLLPKSLELIVMVPEEKDGPSTSFKLSDDQVSVALLSSILKEKSIPVILL
eukprot:CAMPEP_0119050570 /NCGR_PEP_ID=MMETSP1177-20130426/70650_1 /TAXON_ID=2985 /ORGANISM="Ochromonas sp, Strain CCMP1899" /LENGTH=395 /DNA_ID=CAMNT_0007029117 /DNA_START=120 /DNA_END=1304 /DNA_ORIENTATION=+